MNNEIIITHASHEKIIEVTPSHDCEYYLGCLFFAPEGNTYNLTNRCEYQYNLKISEDAILRTKGIFFKYTGNEEPILSVISDLCNHFYLDPENEVHVQLCKDLLDESESPYTVDIKSYGDSPYDEGGSDWIIQQHQGILAHLLGYDCAESYDEQGTVYIAYCVDREMEEVKM